jgi:hypothetical protein
VIINNTGTNNRSIRITHNHNLTNRSLFNEITTTLKLKSKTTTKNQRNKWSDQRTLKSFFVILFKKQTEFVHSTHRHVLSHRAMNHVLRITLISFLFIVNTHSIMMIIMILSNEYLSKNQHHESWIEE